MFGAIKNRVLDGLDLAVEFTTLGEYRLDGPADSGRCPDISDSWAASAFDWPAAPCGGPTRRRGAQCLVDGRCA